MADQISLLHQPISTRCSCPTSRLDCHLHSTFQYPPSVKIMKIPGLAFLVVGLSTSLLSAQVVIDDFNQSGVTLSQVLVGTATQTVADAGILGGARDDSLSVVPVDSGNEFIGFLGFANGNLTLSQGAEDEVAGALVYDNLNGVDLTASGTNTQFLVDFFSSDAPTTLSNILSISVTSGSNTATSFIDVPSASNLGDSTIDFANFAGVDFTSVDSIALEFDFASSPGRDFAINTFSVASAVPEPSSAVVCCLVAAGMLVRRRR